MVKHDKSFEEWRKEKYKELDKRREKMSDKFTSKKKDMIVYPPKK